MKIYFAGSIRGGRTDVDLYLQIIEHLRLHGEVLTEHIGDAALTSYGENDTTDEFIHDRDMDWLLSADLIVAEVTNPSLGVGYEIGRAIENGKKVCCLYREQSGKRLSAMIGGASAIQVAHYNEITSALAHIDKFIQESSEN